MGLGSVSPMLLVRLTVLNLTLQTEVPFICEQFNCHGFKQCADYILKCIANCDVMCLSETWLRQNELQLIEKSLQHEHLYQLVSLLSLPNLV